MTGWAFLAFGLVVGMLSGLTGIGGGVVLVPGLVLLFGLSQTEAQGTSLAVLMLPVVAFAVMVYYQNGFIRVSNVTWIAAGFAVGAYFGASLVPHAPIVWLRTGLGVVLFYVAVLFLFDLNKHPIRAAMPTVVALLLSRLRHYLLGRSDASPLSTKPPFDQSADYHI
jgi:uncharacterized protein